VPHQPSRFDRRGLIARQGSFRKSNVVENIVGQGLATSEAELRRSERRLIPAPATRSRAAAAYAASTISICRGIANTRARLDQLYGASHQFSFRKPASGGTIVIMDIPARMKSNTAGGAGQESHPAREEKVDAHSHDYRG